MLELNGTNFISENERGGSARSLFWPWAAANVGVIIALVIGFFGHLLLARKRIEEQER